MNEAFVSRHQKQALSFRIDRKTHQALKFHCLDHGLTMQDILEKLIVNYVEEKGCVKSRASVKKKVSCK